MACQAPAAPTGSAEIIHGELTFDGRDRTYRLYVPGSLDAGSPVPLVLVLHGNGPDGDEFADRTGLEATAEQEGFLAVFPNALDGIWNAGFSNKPDDVDDVGFLTALVAELGSQYSIDTERVFATGNSGGGMMTYRMACEASTLIAAVAAFGSTMTVDCDPDLPVGVLHVHGEDDDSIPIEGREDRDQPPAAEVVEAWSGFNGCEGAAEVVTEGPSTITSWDECDSNTAVEFYAVAGMSHRYPRADEGSPVDGPSLSWAFFTEHARGAA